MCIRGYVVIVSSKSLFALNIDKQRLNIVILFFIVSQ